MWPSAVKQRGSNSKNMKAAREAGIQAGLVKGLSRELAVAAAPVNANK